MHQILLSAVASGLYLFYDPSYNSIAAHPSDVYCPKVRGTPTVYNIQDHKCYDLARLGINSVVVTIDKDNDGDPEQVYSNEAEGWVRRK